MKVNTTNKCKCCYTSPYPVSLELMRVKTDGGSYYAYDGMVEGYGTDGSISVFYQIRFNEGSIIQGFSASSYFAKQSGEILNGRGVAVLAPKSQGIVAGVTEAWIPEGWGVNPPPYSVGEGYVARAVASYVDRISGDVADLAVFFQFVPPTNGDSFDYFNPDGTPLDSCPFALS